MKICKVRPDHSTCSACVATQEMFNVVDDCSKCKLNTDTYELLQVGTGFWSGDYAMVQKDGKITKVSLSRIKISTVLSAPKQSSSTLLKQRLWRWN